MFIQTYISKGSFQTHYHVSQRRQKRNKFQQNILTFRKTLLFMDHRQFVYNKIQLSEAEERTQLVYNPKLTTITLQN